MANRFWVGGGSANTWVATGNTNWSATSGGANNASVPGSADTAIFDANSGAGNSVISAGIVIALLNCTGYTGTITHNASVVLQIAGTGTITLVSGMTYTVGNISSSIIRFAGSPTPTQTLFTGGKILGSIQVGSSISTILTLGDALTCAGGIDCETGNFTTAGFAVESLWFLAGFQDLGVQLDTQNTTWTITGNDTQAPNLGGQTVWHAGPINNAGFYYQNGTNSFLKFTDTTANIKTVLDEGGSPNNYPTIWFTGIGIGDYRILGFWGNTLFNSVLVGIQDDNTSAHNLILQSGIFGVFNITNWNVNGVNCSTRIALQSSTPGTQASIIDASGTDASQYITIKDIAASGGATFNATFASNISNNTGWNFLSACPITSSLIPSFF